MVGIVILAHGVMGEGLLSTCNMLVGSQEDIVTVAFSGFEPLEEYKETVAAAVKSVDKGEGVLLTVDLKGGTPSNTASIVAYEKGAGYKIVSGVNIPMLVSVLLSRSEMDLESLTQLAVASGSEGVEEVIIRL